MAEEKTTQRTEIIYTRPGDDILSFYANNVSVGGTAFDLRIVFGEAISASPTAVTIEQRVRVTMAWLEAKMLSQFLAKNIEMYEALNGPIKTPKIESVQAPPSP